MSGGELETHREKNILVTSTYYLQWYIMIEERGEQIQYWKEGAGLGRCGVRRS
jgi:hypothetical protein